MNTYVSFSLFNVTRRVVDPLKLRYQKSHVEHELSFISLYFGILYSNYVEVYLPSFTMMSLIPIFYFLRSYDNLSNSYTLSINTLRVLLRVRLTL